MRRILLMLLLMLMLAAFSMSLSGCAASLGQFASGQTINQVVPTTPTLEVRSNDDSPVVFVDGGPIEISSPQQLISSDLIIEGTITGEKTRFVPDTTATNAELADRRARGLPVGVDVTTYEVAVDKVLKGETESVNITVDLSYVRHVYNNGLLYDNPSPPQVGDRVVLSLVDISADPTQAPDQAKYRVIASSGQFRIEKDNTLSARLTKRGKRAENTFTNLHAIYTQFRQFSPRYGEYKYKIGQDAISGSGCLGQFVKQFLAASEPCHFILIYT